jgi:uncharacterized protein YnzC (UPF0291/DUF896 family)
MDQKKIDRINELARKAKPTCLTEEEQAERDALRKEYIAAFRGNLEQQLENTWIEEEDGTRRKLRRRDECQ